jgi:hypothetical protein
VASVLDASAPVRCTRCTRTISAGQGGIVVWTLGSRAHPDRVLCRVCAATPGGLQGAGLPLDQHVVNVALEAMASELRRLDGLPHDVVVH